MKFMIREQSGLQAEIRIASKPTCAFEEALKELNWRLTSCLCHNPLCPLRQWFRLFLCCNACYCTTALSWSAPPKPCMWGKNLKHNCVIFKTLELPFHFANCSVYSKLYKRRKISLLLIKLFILWSYFGFFSHWWCNLCK